MRRAQRRLTIVGLLALAAGAAAIAVPAAASLTATAFLGAVLIVAGAVALGHAWELRGQEGGAARVLRAVVALVLGIWLVAFPLTGTFTLTVLLAVWFLATGGLQLAAWWQVRGRPGAGWLGLNGAAAVILGGLVIADLPSSALWALGLLLGVDLAIWGIRLLAAARGLRGGNLRAWAW
jgi:uncharacterized membrane protein HdeD (DUF308 family)